MNVFSRLKKKIKHPLTGRKRKPGRTGADASGESVRSEGSLPRPEPRVVAGGSHDQDSSGANADGRQARPTDRPPPPGEPESVPVRGSENDQQGGEGDVGEGEGVQSRLHPQQDSEATVESGVSQEGNEAGEAEVEGVESAPIPACSGQPDSM